MTVENSDSLFDEATDELESDVEENLTAAEDALPDADNVWDVESQNVVGVLNQLQTSLDVSEAESAFTEARKWYVLGKKADAFTDEQVDDFEDRFETVEGVIETAGVIRDDVGSLIPEFPELKEDLEQLDAGGSGESEEPDGSEEIDDEGDEDTDSEETETESGEEQDGSEGSSDDAGDEDGVADDDDDGSGVEGTGDNESESSSDSTEGEGEDGDSDGNGDDGPAESWGSDDEETQSSFA